MTDTLRTVLGGVARSYVLFVVLGLVIGLTLAPVAWETTESEGTVAVVPVAGAIEGGTANEYSAMLERARQNGDVAAVVLLVNSGGGAASASESMYIETKRTAKEMPLVASIDATAASGAYYAIAPSDRIFAKPSSVVGSVGVLATAPTDSEPNDIVATTGPNKLTGADRREFYAIVESLGEAFYNAVMEGRGDALKLSRTELAQARVYPGGAAVQNGLADEIGGRRAAIAHAADQADLDNYDVRMLRPDGPVRFVSRANYLGADVPNEEMVDPSYLTGDSAGPVFLMVPGTYLAESSGDGDRLVAGTADADEVTRSSGADSIAGTADTDGIDGAGNRSGDVADRIARPPEVVG